MENWIQLKEDDRFVNMALGAIRAVYTYLRSLNPKISRNMETYYWADKHEKLVPTRFDVIENQIKVQKMKNIERKV